MDTDKRGALRTTASCGLVIIALAFLLLIVFFGGAPLKAEEIGPRLGLPLLAFIAVSFVLINGKAKFFDPEKLKSSAGNKEILINLGSTPLKSLIFIALCSLAFLIPVFSLGQYTGIRPDMKTPVFLLCFSVALLGSAFVYVFTDRLVSLALLENNLASYPRDLREERQSVKLFIIPAAVAIIAFLFSMGITMLTIARSGKAFAEMRGGDWSLAFIAIPFLLIVFVLAFNIKNNTAVLYQSITVQLENLSSAKKDLTRRVSICSVDELGSIAGMVNNFTENMKEGMRAIKNSHHTLSVSGINLKQEAVSIADSLTQISNSIEQIRSKSEGQMRSVDESSAVMREITKNIDALDSSITIQSSSVSKASAAVEEMVGNINSIGSMVDHMMGQFKTVASAAGDGSRIQKESGVKVQEIVEESQALLEANRIIATIAAQTNLLAMNAAIEAAHAGEAGRGFAVVADEIRKLAETSSRESSKISAELKQISETINDIVKGTDASNQAFEQVSLRVTETEKLVFEVNSAIKEQQTGVGQVLRALKVMNDVSGEVSAGSGEMSKGNTTMLAEMTKLQGGSREISASVDKIADSIIQVNLGAQKVSALAETNQSAIGNITGVVDEFEI